MSLQAFIGGIWRTPARGEAYVNGAWRKIIRGEAYVGGQWRSILSLVGPLSVTANNARRAGPFPTDATRTLSASSTAIPSGGRGPYSYAWAVTSGSFTVSNADKATVTFSATLFGGDERKGTARVVCTDAGGMTATADITITLQNVALEGGTS